MIQTTALVSAYYAKNFIITRLENLTGLSVPVCIAVICQSGSFEHQQAKPYADILITTKNIPTLYTAWNQLIVEASTPYITSANCDDLFTRHGLEYLERQIFSSGDIVYGKITVQTKGLRPGKRRVFRDNSLSTLLTTCTPGPMPLWKRDLHRTVGLFDDSYLIAGDYDFWARCVRAGYTIKSIPDVVGIYAKRPDSLERRYDTTVSYETRKVQKKIKEWLNDKA